MKTESIEVFCLYYSANGREVSFCDLKEETDFIDFSDYSANAIFNCMGGFSIALNKYNVIFSSHNFYNLLKVISFLIGGIYLLKNKSNYLFDVSENQINFSIKLGNNEIFEVSKIYLNEVKISYLPLKEEYRHYRGSRFFQDIRLSKDIWIDAISTALDEYFFVVHKIIENEEKDYFSAKIEEYYKEWINIKKYL